MAYFVQEWLLLHWETNESEEEAQENKTSMVQKFGVQSSTRDHSQR
jgi:hypothetical protein